MTRRVNYSQLDRLWFFLNENREVAMGFNKSMQAREDSRRMWIEVAKVLNGFEGGAEKNGKAWNKYWVDYKAKIKAKLKKSKEGGSEEFTEIENRYLQIIGDALGDDTVGEEEVQQMEAELIELDFENTIHSDPLVEELKSELSSNPSSPVRIAAPSPPPTKEANPQPQTSARPPMRRRRRFPREPSLKLMTPEATRLALVRSSERRVMIEERRNAILDTRLQQLIQAVHHCTEMIRNRFPPRRPANTNR